MKYCKNCLMPETKPDLAFNEEGKCSACIAFEERDNVDWNAREKILKIYLKLSKKILLGLCSSS